jgi:hypothetical protein
MTARAALEGWSARIGLEPDEAMEDMVGAVVRAALTDANLGLDDIDMVVTCASDLLDGGMVATRSGIAGSYGRELMTVPSSAGHAFAAAATQIESGAARTVLLVGWGEGSKRVARDSRIIEADPFYTRPLGADAVAMAALQAQRLAGKGRIVPDEVRAYRDSMARRAGVVANTETNRWLHPSWADGAAAIVLTARGGHVVVQDFGTAFEPYCPEPDRLDPAAWVAAAMPRFSALAAIECGGPTPFAEVAAVADLLLSQDWGIGDTRFNRSGGSAVAHLGPAAGLQRIVAVADYLASAPPGAVGAVIDLAGPIGQAATVVLLQAGAA